VWRDALAIIRRYPVATVGPALFLGALTETPYLFPDSRSVFQGVLAFLTESFAFYLYVAYAEELSSEARRGRFIPLPRVLRDLFLAAPFVPLVTVASLGAITLPKAAASVLVVPGLWLLTRWSLFAPVIVRENLGPLAALRRSNELVRGHFELVFLTAALAVVLEEAVMDAGALVGLALTGSGTWGEWAGGSAAAVMVLPVASFATALAYGELRHPQSGLPRMQAVVRSRRGNPANGA
jgi:hypothetical protein